MTPSLLTAVIRYTFLREVGKHQVKNGTRNAMLMSFATPTEKDEDGYRYLDVLIYGPMNYVGVYIRRRWNVIPEADLGDDDEGPLPGKSYNEGEEPWRLVSYHDSGWPEGISKILEKEHLLAWSHVGGDRDWYRIVDMADYKLPET